MGASLGGYFRTLADEEKGGGQIHLTAGQFCLPGL